MKYSIIILLKFENDDLVEFLADIDGLFRNLNEAYEILIIRDGGVGRLSEKSKAELLKINVNLHLFQLPAKTTEALCLSVGMKESAGDVIIVFGSYQQVSTQSLKKMIDALGDTADLVIPYRQKRLDSKFNQFQSKVFNWLLKISVKSKINDVGCKVKVFKRKVLENVNLYGNMYSFLPIFAMDKGFKVREIHCDHFKDYRKTGVRSISEYFVILLDILTLFFNARFNRKPLRFFSSVGVVFMVVGFLILSYVFLEKMFFGTLIGERPVLLLSLLFAVIGIQVASVGLLGEIIAFVYGRHRKEYTVDKVI
jgi:hypothetical protein